MLEPARDGGPQLATVLRFGQVIVATGLEPAHAIARLGEVAHQLGKDGLVILNLCGRGDKDVFSVAKALGVDV